MRILTVIAMGTLLAAPTAARGDAACPGDCNGDGRVTIAEVVTVIGMNLGRRPVSACPNGARQPGNADNVDVVCAFRNALFSTCQSCP